MLRNNMNFTDLNSNIQTKKFNDINDIKFIKNTNNIFKINNNKIQKDNLDDTKNINNNDDITMKNSPILLNKRARRGAIDIDMNDNLNMPINQNLFKKKSKVSILSENPYHTNKFSKGIFLIKNPQNKRNSKIKLKELKNKNSIRFIINPFN